MNVTLLKQIYNLLIYVKESQVLASTITDKSQKFGKTLMLCIGPEASTLYSLQKLHAAACSNVPLISVAKCTTQAAAGVTAGEILQDNRGRLHAARTNILHQPHPNTSSLSLTRQNLTGHFGLIEECSER